MDINIIAHYIVNSIQCLRDMLRIHTLGAFSYYTNHQKVTESAVRSLKGKLSIIDTLVMFDKPYRPSRDYEQIVCLISFETTSGAREYDVCILKVLYGSLFA